MSDLQALHTEVSEYRAEAGRIAEGFTRAHSEIESDPSLTVAGKRERLQPLHTETVEQIAALRAREKTAVKAVKEKLERRLFGLSSTASTNPANLVSFRDAQSRVRQLENSDDAVELYESAKRSGDKILANAVLERALVRGWSSIKADFLENNSAARGDLDDLAALARYNDNGLINAVHYMPPSLNLPYPSGMPDIKPLHSRREPQRRTLREGFGTGW